MLLMLAPFKKIVNYAKLLIDSNDESGMDIEYHLRRSFTDGDGNTEAQSTAGSYTSMER